MKKYIKRKVYERAIQTTVNRVRSHAGEVVDVADVV